MNSRVLISGLVAGIAAFFLGWAIFGILLDPWYKANMTHPLKDYGPALRHMESVRALLCILAACLASGLLFAWLLDKMNVRSAAGAFMPMMFVSALTYLSFDLFMYAFMDLYRIRVYAVDVLVNALFGGVIGMVAGWMLGRGKAA